jgi:hypothetical protein
VLAVESGVVELVAELSDEVIVEEVDVAELSVTGVDVEVESVEVAESVVVDAVEVSVWAGAAPTSEVGVPTVDVGRVVVGFGTVVSNTPHAPRVLCIVPLFTKMQYGLPVARSRMVMPLSCGVVVEPTERAEALTVAALTVCAFTIFTYSVVAVSESAMSVVKWNIPFSIATPRVVNQLETIFVTVIACGELVEAVELAKACTCISSS